MSVRKRKWTTSKGVEREAWVVAYAQGKERHIETFEKKKDADARHAQVSVNVKAGTHVAPSKSVTVKEAGEKWIKTAEGAGLERTTIAQYRQHLDTHIVPFLGGIRLSALNVPTVRNFEDRLRHAGRSAPLVRKVLISLSSILSDAHERGYVAQNVVRDLRRSKRRKRNESRKKGKLVVGVDIPTPEDIKGILAHAKGRWRPLLVTAVFTGLRASELRGLRWADVDLKASELKVRQRADRFNVIGQPKSASGQRVVPFGKVVTNTLKEWKLACPKGELVFPNREGKVLALTNIIMQGLWPAQRSSGVIDREGQAKYTGLHSLRHFYASWCINRPQDGGLGLPAKVVQERLGHSSITMTMDTYGHLFPRGDDTEQLDAVELTLVAT
jgi:integrase